MDEVFAALADPTRRAVLERLLIHGPTTATALSPSFDMSRQAVVKHLAVLSGAGLVTAERHGREVRYAGRTEPLVDAAAWLAATGAAWDRRLARLSRQLARTTRTVSPRATVPAQGTQFRGTGPTPPER
jgi:DNA-binding transcriptional ArsR family regulator